MKHEYRTCDIDGCETDKDGVIGDMLVQVTFTTEQTEGKPCPHHLVIVKMDVCKHCQNRMINGEHVFAHGAQGSNTYYFKP